MSNIQHGQDAVRIALPPATFDGESEEGLRQDEVRKGIDVPMGKLRIARPLSKKAKSTCAKLYWRTVSSSRAGKATSLGDLRFRWRPRRRSHAPDQLRFAMTGRGCR